jgi:hypothetical protein
MSIIERIRKICPHFIARPGDEDIGEEIQALLQIKIDENIEAGMPPSEARYAAQRKFGNAVLFKEMTEEVWNVGWLEKLRQDVRIAWRMLAKSRVFTFAVVFTLAIGIGSTTVIYTVVHSVLFPDYSYADPPESFMSFSNTKAPRNLPRRLQKTVL